MIFQKLKKNVPGQECFARKSPIGCAKKITHRVKIFVFLDYLVSSSFLLKKKLNKNSIIENNYEAANIVKNLVGRLYIKQFLIKKKIGGKTIKKQSRNVLKTVFSMAAKTLKYQQRSKLDAKTKTPWLKKLEIFGF